MSLIYVDAEAMEIAANRCRQLADKLQECKQECISLNAQLQECYKGAAARSFSEYIEQTASRTIDECSEMIRCTGEDVMKKCRGFTDTDNALSGGASL